MIYRGLNRRHLHAVSNGLASSVRRVLGLIAWYFLTLTASQVHADTITVNSLADDVFPDVSGALFDASNNPVTLNAPKCTLRMALAAANGDTPVGGVNGCPSGNGSDVITFDSTLFSAGGLQFILLNPSIRMPVATTPSYTNNTSLLIVTRPLTINGPGSNSLRIATSGSSANWRYRLLGIYDGDNAAAPISVAINDVTFANATVKPMFNETTTPPTVVSRPNGGCVGAFESVQLTNVNFFNCRALTERSAADATVYANGFGGALAIAAPNASAAKPDATLNSVLITSGGAFTTQTYVSGTATSGYYGGVGGAFAATNLSNLTINNSTFQSTQANSGGCLSVSATQTVTVSNVFVLNCYAFGDRNGQPAGAPNYFENNDLGYSGGFRFASIGTLTINRLEAQNNFATSDRAGGEIRDINALAGFTGSGLTASNLLIEKNSALGNLGGAGNVGGLDIRNIGGTNNSVSSSTFRGNSAANFFGGARVRLFNAASAIRFTGLMVSSNRANQSSAGIHIETAGRYEVVQSSVVFNQIPSNQFSAGLSINSHSVNANDVKVNVYNSTFALNSGQGSTALSVFAFNASGGATPNANINIVSSILGNSAPGAADNPVGADAVNAAQITYANTLIEGPNTGVLNEPAVCVNGVVCGGSAYLVASASAATAGVNEYLRPQRGSLALNSGANPLALATDQRGRPRASGPIDMGALEVQANEIAPAAQCSLDMDSDSQVLAAKEGLVLLRAMLGFSATNAVAGTGISPGQWDTARNNLNTHCGTNFAP